MLKLVCAAARYVWAHVKALPLRAAVALGASGLGAPPRPDQLWKAYTICGRPPPCKAVTVI
jgi:hypothetical protein